MTNKRKGMLGEVKVMAKLIELGYNVAVPYGDNAPYDLILDYNGTLLRLQVKTSSGTSDGKTSFEIGRRRRNSKGQRRVQYSKDEIDYFALYSVVRDKIYLVSADDAPSEEISIRYEPTKNNNVIGVHMEDDYLIDVVLQRMDD